MEIRIIKDPISRTEFADIVKNQFGNLVKAVVDIEKDIMAIGGDLHADEEGALMQEGSRQEYLWGINLYPEKFGDDFIEFDSMTNIRPSQGNHSRSVEDPAVREKIIEVVKKLVRES